MSNFRCLALFAGVLGLLLASCAKEPPPPRTRDEIFQEKIGLPALYLGAQTHREVIAPMSKGLHVDAQSGEVMWPALECGNPDCPGRVDGKPFIFIEPDDAVFIKSDGSIGYDKVKGAQAANKVRTSKKVVGPCPACAQIRKPGSETPQQTQQYINWVHPHVLPETATRLTELEEELQRAIRVERESRVIKPAPVNENGPKPTKADPASRPKS